MRLYLPLALIVAGLVGACAGKDPSPDQLAHGCQIVKCVCLKVRDTMLPSLSKPQDTELQWRPDGSAFCPTGFALELKDKPSMYDRPLY
jgi:hypothetical protein